MEQTFITIHNLSTEGTILFASESITDILGYQPCEVQNKSCFDFFHPDEVPFARSIHSRGIRLDKAAVLHYARIFSKNGTCISCECCFTIVHDVLVACTSVYRQNERSERRALEAPRVRRLFSCSSQDPRFHMLEHLTSKFRMPPMEHEPRAALIVNRFTRSLRVLFSTDAVSTILGLSPEELQDQSFYDCIQESCLPEAIRCLEGAKANDSIAYLRFWFRDPRQRQSTGESNIDYNRIEERASSLPRSSMSPMGENAIMEGSLGRLTPETPSPGVRRGDQAHPNLDDMDDMDNMVPWDPSLLSSKRETPASSESGVSRLKRSSSEPSVRLSEIPQKVPLGQRLKPEHSPSPSASSSRPFTRREASGLSGPTDRSCELEAVVSCASDGLVVVLRRARPPHPSTSLPRFAFSNEGLFAAPWAQQPLRPSCRPYEMPVAYPQRVYRQPEGAPLEYLMRSIQDVAVFAWALVGINQNLATYGRGVPEGYAAPPSNYEHPDRTSRSWDMDSIGGQPLRFWQEPVRMNEAASSQRHHSMSNHPALEGVDCECGRCFVPSRRDAQSNFDSGRLASQAPADNFEASGRPGQRCHFSDSSLATANSWRDSFAESRGNHDTHEGEYFHEKYDGLDDMTR